MNSKAVPADFLLIFDRDNTLTVDHGYTYEIESFEWRKGIPKILSMLASLEATFTIASNQGGIALGKFTLEQAVDFNKYLAMRAQEFEFIFDEVVFCPHSRFDQPMCSFRKPNTGMIEYMIAKYNVNREKVVFIGDSLEDELSSKIANISFVNIADPDLLTVITNKVLA